MNSENGTNAKFYNSEDVILLSNALKEAFISVGCSLKCFDWLSYHPDFHIEKQKKKAA